MTKQRRVLLISHDIVGSTMAGPGIRYYELAGELSQHFNVTLATPNVCDLTLTDVSIQTYSSSQSLRSLIEQHDVIFAQLIEPMHIAHALKHDKVIIYDLYNLIPIEYLGSLKHSHQDLTKADVTYQNVVEEYLTYLQSGSYFVCSNDRQADFLMGMLTASRSILPSTTAQKTLSEIVGLVPFGLPNDPPQKSKTVLRGVVPGINQDDFVVLWAGGIWDWFDPISLIDAMADLRKAYPSIKLVFIGTTHPNKDIGEVEMAKHAQAHAKKLGLFDVSVFFLKGWLPYQERIDYLLEADVATSIHFDSIETRYAFRTRILDHLWAGLPSIVTIGDSFAEIIQDRGIGSVVNYEDRTGIAAAITFMYENPAKLKQMKSAIKQLTAEHTWKRNAQVLIDAISGLQAIPKQRPEALQSTNALARLRSENHRLTRELDLSQTHFHNVSQDLANVLASKRWRIGGIVSKIYHLGRKS